MHTNKLVFQVLQIDPEATDTELKKRFRAVRKLPPDPRADSLTSMDKLYHPHFRNRRNSHPYLNIFPFFIQLSILVHPDKNQDDPDRAQKAFEGRSPF